MIKRNPGDWCHWNHHQQVQVWKLCDLSNNSVWNKFEEFMTTFFFNPSIILWALTKTFIDALIFINDYTVIRLFATRINPVAHGGPINTHSRSAWCWCSWAALHTCLINYNHKQHSSEPQWIAGRKKMFYFTVHSTHFIYGYMCRTYGKGPSHTI